MQKNNFTICTALISTLLLKASLAQSQEPSSQFVLEPVSENKAQMVSPEKIKETVNNILMNNKAVSLMFDDEESSKIDRAVDSLKNNQTYVPDPDAGEPSKEMTEEEKKAIAQKAEEEEKKKLENEKSYAYLGSILYLSPKDWVVWINQKKITSKTNKSSEEIYIRSIEKDHIKVSWKIAVSKWKILSGKSSESMAPKINSNNQVEFNFTLKTNQAFSLITNRVIEGRGGAAIVN